jgi:hypothetical protein
MIKPTIAFTWEHGHSHRAVMPTAKEMEDLVAERRERLHLLQQTTPLAGLATTDFWDAILVEMIGHYLDQNVATPFEMSEREMDRRQIEHVIKTRFGTTPGGVLGTLDKDARAIARYIEQGWEDALWAG